MGFWARMGCSVTCFVCLPALVHLCRCPPQVEAALIYFFHPPNPPNVVKSAKTLSSPKTNSSSRLSPCQCLTRRLLWRSTNAKNFETKLVSKLVEKREKRL